MTCNRILTGAPLNLAALDAIIEPIINGFWFYLLFEVFNFYKFKVQTSAAGRSSKNPSLSQSSKFASKSNGSSFFSFLFLLFRIFLLLFCGFRVDFL